MIEKIGKKQNELYYGSEEIEIGKKPPKPLILVKRWKTNVLLLQQLDSALNNDVHKIQAFGLG